MLTTKVKFNITTRLKKNQKSKVRDGDCIKCIANLISGERGRDEGGVVPCLAFCSDITSVSTRRMQNENKTPISPKLFGIHLLPTLTNKIPPEYACY